MTTPHSADRAPEGSDSHPPRRLGRYHVLALIGALPLLALAVFAYALSARAVERLVHANNQGTATVTAALIEREFEHWSAALTGISYFPALRAAIASGDVTEVRRRLEVFVEAHGRLDRAFVTDPTGLLWSDYPRAPESLGARFNDRDWFRGVSTVEGPYVSEVYRRNAEPQLLVVAVAVPVRDPVSEALTGYLVAQVRLDGLSTLLRRVELGGDAVVLLLDHSGALVAHPTLDLQAGIHREYSGVSSTLPGAEGEARRGRYSDPLAGEEVLASALPVPVGTHRWTVVAQQPIAQAFAPTRALAVQLAAAALVTILLVGGLLWALARTTARRREAEKALAALNEDLERRVAERTAELRKTEEELLHSQKLEAVGRLAGGVAHDFNNLLSVILGCADFALDQLADDDPVRADVQAARGAGERAAELTKQLLAFSRKQMTKPEILDVNEAVRRMQGILERVLGEDIDLECRLAGDLHPVKFDPGQIEQVVMNLAVNARDAMPRGGRLTIETYNVELDEDYVLEHPEAKSGPHVILAISDTGEGMDAETRARIFEPFFTTKKPGSGTGLGLSTVYGIVRQGEGNIWVYSEPGRGTTFKVYLPRTTEVPPSTDEPTEWDEQRGTGTILVVEDDDAVRSLVVRILERAGYEVASADNLASASRIMESADPPVDLLLSDVVLADTTGPEVASKLRELRPDLAVLFMSGYTDEAIVRHGVLEDASGYIEKPFRPRELLATVKRALAGRASV